MTRSLTSAVKTELATNDIRPVHLITIGFGTPVNITDCSFPLTSSVSGTTITIAGDDASTSAKGVAQFSSDNFAASSGTITIKDGGVVTDEIAADAICGTI